MKDLFGSFSRMQEVKREEKEAITVGAASQWCRSRYVEALFFFFFTAGSKRKQTLKNNWLEEKLLHTWINYDNVVQRTESKNNALQTLQRIMC